MFYEKAFFPFLLTDEFKGNDNKHFFPPRACIQAYTTCACLVLLWRCRLWNCNVWKKVLQCVSMVFISCFLHFHGLSISSLPPFSQYFLKVTCPAFKKHRHFGRQHALFFPSTVSKYCILFGLLLFFTQPLALADRRSGVTEAFVQLFYLKSKLQLFHAPLAEKRLKQASNVVSNLILTLKGDIDFHFRIQVQ